MGRGLGIGGGLVGSGMGMQQEGMEMLGQAADMQQRREQNNQQLEMQREAGNKQLGAMGGAAVGFAVGGPIGAMIGGTLGAVAGGLFAFVLAVVLGVTLALPTTAEARVLTQMEVHQILKYDPETGFFTWLDPAARRMSEGDRAGYRKMPQGYRYIKIGGKAYAEHRLACLYMLGQWPAGEIDHVNRIRDDNRFCNLRDASHKQNAENRKDRAGARSGFRGVSYSNGKWVASITHFGEQKVLGYFDDIEEAKDARLKAEAELFTHSTRV